jgi:hypothetical protein
MTKNHVDPFDPSNVELMEKVAAAMNSKDQNDREKMEGDANNDKNVSMGSSSLIKSSDAGYFRLESHHDQLLFCSRGDIERNQRFRLLKLRNARVQEFRNYRMVPATDKEIPKGVFESIGKKYTKSYLHYNLRAKILI